ncbi:bestrophin family protein [Pseudogemmobacter blasticus]|uniref:Bestrophin n=1 Tax=Fuscovulum blasticum DSM 2131 TaxID=1188250 RepID=A0A2T4JCU7_FUSBL|nr:bestrophin family ion channel [Fuscovulum blasticum]PTE15735.1 hypothetical protein C5F44_05080 [Fuscovulum blasticum DSM 2131]
MIVREKPRLWDLLTAMRGSVVPHIVRPLLFLTGFALVVVWLDHFTPYVPKLETSAYATFGIGLSLFLGFRNNAAYDRWWEARKLWGGMLADMRSLARETDVFVPDAAERRTILHLAIAFVHAHRLHLRGQKLTAESDVPETARALAGTPHPPCTALDRMNSVIARAHREGRIDGFGARALTTRMSSIALQQAGCERIFNTPLPFVYSLLIYRTTFLYCMMLPFALNSATGWMTPIFVGVVAYMFLGLAEVTEELAHPFGLQPNGLALDAICRAVEISFAPHLGTEPPPPLRPVNYYLI